MKKIFITSIFSLLILSFYSCKKGSGFYCAKVDRYNPRTGKESSYTLKIEIEDDKVVKLFWPNKGHSDNDEFSPASVINSKATFTDYDGVNYRVEVLNEYSSSCYNNVAKAVRCKGMTKKNKRCKNETDNASGYCYLHDR